MLAREESAYLYDLACYRALSGSLLGAEKEAADLVAAALQALEQAVTAGYDNAHKLKTDPLRGSLRASAEFEQLLADLGHKK